MHFCWVELTALFTNQGLTAPELKFGIPRRVRAGTTCRAEILAAVDRLDGGGPAKWHLRDDIIDEVQSATTRYSRSTIRRILSYDIAGVVTSHHVATQDLERDGDWFRRRQEGMSD